MLRESYRHEGKVKHRTIAHLSPCSEAEIAAIKIALRHKGDLALLGSVQELNAQQGPRIGAVCCLQAVAQRLGLAQALGARRPGKLALWQVFAWLMDQGSRLSAVRLAESHAAGDLLGLEAFHEEHLDQNLAWGWLNTRRPLNNVSSSGATAPKRRNCFFMMLPVFLLGRRQQRLGRFRLPPGRQKRQAAAGDRIAHRSGRRAELGSVRGIEVAIANVKCQKVPQPTGLNQELLAAAQVKLPDTLPLRKTHAANRKNCQTTNI